MNKYHSSSSSSNQETEQTQENLKQNALYKPKFLAPFVNAKKRVAHVGDEVFNTAHEVGSQAAKYTYQLIEQATSGAGRAMTSIGNLPLIKNPFVQKLAGVFRLDWLLGISTSVDLDKVDQEVKQLKNKYKNESAFEIAHRIIVAKAAQASGIGFVSSILPGSAAALLAVDFAATTALQTEMIYEIAGVYDMNLHDTTRQGEVLAIFGLALGGRNALKAGLGFMRNIPLAGAMIGASTNATMLYTLGYTACRFYETKKEEVTEEPTTETLKALQQESEQYLDTALTQQAIMDQVLVHMIIASYPEKNWSDIVPELEKLQIAPESINTIAANIQSPQPLEVLLNQLNPDFALSLLAQCRQLALHNDELSAEEETILAAIASKLDDSYISNLNEQSKNN